MVKRMIWGLTGGIGSGKSTVAGILSALGATIVDADAISRSLTEVGGPAIPAIQRAFGAEAIAPDGSMNRDWVRAKVFSDATAKQVLESILHPLIGSATQAAINAAPTTWVICDVPLLVESARWRREVQGVWVVDCTIETQIERVRARNHWTESTIRSVIDKQATRLQRLQAADVITYNDHISRTQLTELVTTQSQKLGIR